MTVMVTGHWGKALEPGVNKWYGNAYKEYPEYHKKMFDVMPSRKAREEDVGVFGMGLAQLVAEGEPVAYDSEKQGFIARYTHLKYALAFAISEELVEDDLYDVVGQRRAKALAFSMRQTKEVVAALVYDRAETTGYTFADGLVLLHTAHLLGKGGTFSNKPATDVDLSEAALEQACIDISNFKDDAGNRIAVQPTSLIIRNENEFIAQRILKSERRVGTNNNDINALMALGAIKDIVVNPFLGDTDAWFLRTNAPDGMKMFMRKNDTFGMTDDFDTSNAKFKASMRFSVGCTDVRGIYGCMGA